MVKIKPGFLPRLFQKTLPARLQAVNRRNYYLLKSGCSKQYWINFVIMQIIQQLVNDPKVLKVDVRSQWEFEMDHLPGALNIPLEEVSLRTGEFQNAGNPVLLYCRSGSRSGMATSILRQQGLTNVYNGGAIDDIQNLLN